MFNLSALDNLDKQPGAHAACACQAPAPAARPGCTRQRSVRAAY